MPNWCNNTITLKHENPEMIVRAQKAFLEGELLQEFAPCPQELIDTSAGWQEELEEQEKANVEKYGYRHWYDFCVSEWGTKWDISPHGCELVNLNELEGSFDTAWSPPIEAYRKLEDLGFVIESMYYESGMGFCGIYDSERFGDEYWDLGGLNSEQIADTIPAELDEEFCISENLAIWEEENEEETDLGFETEENA